MRNALHWPDLCFLIVFHPFPGPGTSPSRFVSKIPAILKCLCVRSSHVVSKLALGQFALDL